MNIDDIEDNLNNHEINLEKAIEVIMNAVAKNQAMLEMVIELQLNLMAYMDDSVRFEDLAKSTSERIETKLAEIQALISRKF